MAPYLTLMTPEAPQREHDLRKVLNGLRWIVRTGVFEASVDDLRAIL